MFATPDLSSALFSITRGGIKARQDYELAQAEQRRIMEACCPPLRNYPAPDALAAPQGIVAGGDCSLRYKDGEAVLFTSGGECISKGAVQGPSLPIIDAEFEMT